MPDTRPTQTLPLQGDDGDRDEPTRTGQHRRASNWVDDRERDQTAEQQHDCEDDRQQQAHLLLAALALNAEPERYREQREAHRAAERDLHRAGLLHATTDPERPHIVHDVRFSLRYFNAPEDDARR